MRCETVVETPYGRIRCVNEDATRIRRLHPTRQNTIEEVTVCPFHDAHPASPQCVGNSPDAEGRCQMVAFHPTTGPQFCVEHQARIEALERRASPPVWTVEATPAGVGWTFTRRETIPPIIFDDPVMPPQSMMDFIEAERLSRSRDEWQTGILETWGVVDPEILRLRNQSEDSMPQVTFSQTALPFVAALVQRLGGEVTVPARRLERWESITFDRVAGGLRFRLMNANGVIRNPTSVVMQTVAPPPAPVAQVEKRIEVERIHDEQEAKLRGMLKRCDECGLQFEKTHKTESGADECPYCVLRMLETKGPATVEAALRMELAAERGALMRKADELKAEGIRRARVEEILQGKLDELVAKQGEIRTLRQKLVQGLNPIAGEFAPPAPITGASISERNRIIRDLRHADPSMSLAEAVGEAQRILRERHIS